MKYVYVYCWTTKRVYYTLKLRTLLGYWSFIKLFLDWNFVHKTILSLISQFYHVLTSKEWPWWTYIEFQLNYLHITNLSWNLPFIVFLTRFHTSHFWKWRHNGQLGNCGDPWGGPHNLQDTCWCLDAGAHKGNQWTDFLPRNKGRRYLYM